MITLSIFPVIQAQSARIKTQLAELDRRLALRYGDRYHQFKQQLEGTKVWYDKTRAEAQRSGTIPLEQKQAETDRQAATAGSAAARKEAVIKQQLKDVWQNLKSRQGS
ncbi:hypothetical protein [Chamaesiphon sp.]|uniref:hypothetical protein n=1 Tax=Chamaesiphon sp. TaxID=2814140 RepID=UPI0035945FD3